MSRLVELVERARSEQRPSLLCDVVPFARFIGVQLSVNAEGGLLATMPFAEHLVGNPGVPALHGGTIGSLLDTTALMMVLWEVDPIVRPRTITLTTDYLRPAQLTDTYAAGEFLRIGRRVVTISLRAWQHEDRLIASGRAHLLIS